MLTRKRKPRPKSTHLPPGKRQRQNGDNLPATPPQQWEPRQNLTVADWLAVYAFIDAHPDVSQAGIVEHFRARPEGPLVFTQPTLSRKLRDRLKMEACVTDNPNALSSKRPGVAARPDVERVPHEHALTTAGDEIIDIDSDEKDDTAPPCVTRAQAMVMCEELCRALLEYGEADHLGLLGQLRRFRAHLQKQEPARLKQATLEHFVLRTT